MPDQRFKYLCDLYNPPSKVPAVLTVTDIAGLIKGAAEGAGLGNAFLSHIAAVDGIYHVIRCFEDDAVVHVDDSIDAVSACASVHVCVRACVYQAQYSPPSHTVAPSLSPP